MAMNGTLDTFDLSDVVALITGTGKSGRLEVDGDHAEGTVSFTDGKIVGSQCGRAAPKHEDVLFELLRNRTGTYVFDADQEAERNGETVDGEVVLAAAQELMAEWVDIYKVVPGNSAYIALVADLDGESVTIGPHTWQIIRAVGGGASVAEIGAAFEVGEFDACRAAKRLIDIGIAKVTEEPFPSKPRANDSDEPIGEQVGPGILTKFLAATDN